MTSSPGKLKVITFNAAILDVRLFGLSFHRPVDHIELRLEAIAKALQECGADIVFIQELFHRNRQDQLCDLLSEDYPCVYGHAAPGLNFRLGNELLTLSRQPLQDLGLVRFQQAPAEELRHTSKGFYHTRLSIPGIGPVDLVNFHMSAGGKNQHPESSIMEEIRQSQVQQLVEYCRGFELVLLAGDLNAGPHSSRKNYQHLLNNDFEDLFSAAGATGITWDPANPLVMAGTDAHLPAQRIDHVLANRSLNSRARIEEAEVVFREMIATASSGTIPLSDHYAVAVELWF